MPYIDYVAGLQSGMFVPGTAHLFRSRKRLIPSPFIEKESVLDKIQKKVDEKYVVI
jgi:hypothetical protein